MSSNSLFTHRLETAVDIDAPVSTVWSILVDLDRYHTWNPFVIEASGQVDVGQRLNVRIQPPGGKAMSFTPVVTEASPNRAFEWLGRVALPRIFDGRHRFDLQSTDGGRRTRLVQSEEFAGLLVPAMRSRLESGTLAGFTAMNEALRLQAENAVDRSSGGRD